MPTQTAREVLIGQVVLRMDEISPAEDLNVPVDGLAGSDNNPLYILVDGLLDSCALELYSVAPYWRLPQTKFSDTDISVEHLVSSDDTSRKYVRLKLSPSFLRVAEINVKGFQRPITEVVPEQSAEGKRQHNRFLMGKEAKPVGVLSFGSWSTTTGTGAQATTTTSVCREIDCYSLPASASITVATDVDASYIEKPAIPTTGNDSTIPAVLEPALVWLTAARAFGARGDANHAAICQQNAQNLLA